MSDLEPLRACIPNLVDLRDGRIGISLFGSWVPPRRRSSDGAILLPFPTYHPPIDALWKAFEAAGYSAEPRDYVSWMSAQAEPFDPDFIGTLDRDALELCLLGMRRGERFCDGFWLGLLERATFLAAAQRVLELADS